MNSHPITSKWFSIEKHLPSEALPELVHAAKTGYFMGWAHCITEHMKMLETHSNEEVLAHLTAISADLHNFVLTRNKVSTE